MLTIAMAHSGRIYPNLSRFTFCICFQSTKVHFTKVIQQVNMKKAKDQSKSFSRARMGQSRGKQVTAPNVKP